MSKRRHEQMGAPVLGKSTRQNLDLSNNNNNNTDTDTDINTNTNTNNHRAWPPVDKVPKFVQYTSPAPSSARFTNGGSLTATTLPLDLIALIVSFLDDVGDLARVTRTSRLLYYMTLPQLYQRVHLHSYAEIKYVNGRPSGFGGGSPFLAALGGLATKGHAALVRELRVFGEWNEVGVEDFAKGIIPANSMMLNILLRAATDNMPKLGSFSWELDCKPLKPLYTGLASHNTLTSLTLKFPSARIPRPSVLIPPIANLRVFKATDIDPMCYPDDISLLLLHSKKIEDLRLHFSPRMRQEAEGIMTLTQFFGRCYKAGYKMRLKHFAMMNFFGPNVLSFENIFDEDVGESIAFFDTFGGNDPRTTFIDDTWRAIPPDLTTNFKRMRVNEVSPEFLLIISRQKRKLERIYLVSAKQPKSGFTPSTATPSLPSAGSPGIPDEDLTVAPLRQPYLETITTIHGSALTHLLLRDCWPLNGDEIADLVRYCPNLEQLGIAVHGMHHQYVRLFMPLMPKLKALRILPNEHLIENLRTFPHEERMIGVGRDIGSVGNVVAQIIGFADFVYKIGRLIEEINEDGSVSWRREVTWGTREDALKWDIWRLDCLDLDVDPIELSSP